MTTTHGQCTRRPHDEQRPSSRRRCRTSARSTASGSRARNRAAERYEATEVFRIYEHNVVPGLFQTAEYCAAMPAFWYRFLDVPDDLEAAVEARMERQRVLYRRDERFVVVLEEQALRTWFGDAEVQAGQLDRLLAVMSLPNLSVGIVPLMTDREAVASTGSWILDDELVAWETPTASIDVTRPDEIALYGRMFDVLSAAALHGQDARRLVLQVIAHGQDRRLR